MAGALPPAAPGPDLATLHRLRSDRAHRRRTELGALAHATRPIASDLAATFLFYAVFAFSGSVIAATLLGIAIGCAQLAWTRWQRRPVPPIQLASLLLVLVAGGLSIAIDDPRPMLFKASLVYLVLGATMLKPGWLARYLPPIAAAHVSPRLVRSAGYGWAALMIGTALVSFALTLTAPPTLTAAVMGIGAPVSKLALFAGQYWWLRRQTRRAIGDRLDAAG